MRHSSDLLCQTPSKVSGDWDTILLDGSDHLIQVSPVVRLPLGIIAGFLYTHVVFALDTESLTKYHQLDAHDRGSCGGTHLFCDVELHSRVVFKISLVDVSQELSETPGHCKSDLQ
jgi:hypothetical protein